MVSLLCLDFYKNHSMSLPIVSSDYWLGLVARSDFCINIVTTTQDKAVWLPKWLTPLTHKSICIVFLLNTCILRYWHVRDFLSEAPVYLNVERTRMMEAEYFCCDHCLCSDCFHPPPPWLNRFPLDLYKALPLYYFIKQTKISEMCFIYFYVIFNNRGLPLDRHPFIL